MDMIDLLEKKKRGLALSDEEIAYFVRGVTAGEIPDYQTSALLMAVRINGMTEAETFALTHRMAHSGETADVSGISGVLADKHSTGGVSDSTTFIIAPALACLGIKMLKASGRGLGFTGGTIDKIEAVPGIRTELSARERAEIVEKCGAVIVSAGGELAPCDKILYALRDVTATVDSLPLIASSVMSKKLAGGSQILLLDVKYGSGAFMKTREEALKLAGLMARIGRRAGRRTACIISSMEAPLTGEIGCNRELIAAVSVLKGQDLTSPLYAVSKEIVRRICALAGKKLGEGEFDILLKSGEAFEKLCEMVSLQGGDAGVLRDTSRLPDASIRTEVRVGASGFVCGIDSEKLGLACVALGGGRRKKGDVIDRSAGLSFKLALGAKVSAGGTVAELFSSSDGKLQAAARLVEQSYTLSVEPPKPEKLLYAYTDGEYAEYYE